MLRCTLSLLAPALLLLPSTGQELGPAPGEPRPDLPVVAAAVGDEIIKFEELIARVQLEMTQGRIRDTREADKRIDELLQEMITQRLKVQAGRDLGFDPKLVENYVDRLVERQKERYGGTIGTSEFLQSYRIGPGEWRGATENEVYADQWELAVLGIGPSASGRPTVDRYIRPGELHAYYQSLLVSRDPQDRAQAGEEREQVVLQELILPVGVKDEQEVLDQARFLLSAYAEGADFTELVERYGVVKDSDGVRKAQPVEALRGFSTQRHGTPDLFQFAASAEQGQVSPPLLGRSSAGDSAVWIYRLVERLPGSGPLPFTDPELQDRLRTSLQERIDDVRENLAINRVARSAYIWPRDSWSAGEVPSVLREIGL